MAEIELEIIYDARGLIAEVGENGCNQPEELQDVMLRDVHGNTVLHVAAKKGNIKEAKHIVETNAKLLVETNDKGDWPIKLACEANHKEMVRYLFSKADKDDDFFTSVGMSIIAFALDNELYDLALCIMEKKPDLAFNDGGFSSPLQVLARNACAFRSGMKFNWWTSFLYDYVPDKLLLKDIIVVDTDHLDPNERKLSEWGEWLHQHFLLVLESIVFPMKNIRHMKAKHYHALKLVKWVCGKIIEMSNEPSPDESDRIKVMLLEDPFLMGARNGIVEILEEIIKYHPEAIYFRDECNYNFFHLGIMNRREKILKLFHSLRAEERHWLLSGLKDDENVLHLVGHMPSENYVDFSSNAILQMQRELQWYKELEKIDSMLRMGMNAKKQTPVMVFDEEHRGLVKKEAKWILSMATSCSVAATVIASAAFSAAIKFPGRNDKNMFEYAFIISNSLALAFAMTTVVTFSSIYTSQHEAHHFWYHLPKRMIAGLIVLMLSIICFVVAFGSYTWTMDACKGTKIVGSVFACIPVFAFVYYQIPSLCKIIKSTYGQSIFK